MSIEFRDFIKSAAGVIPSERQIEWFNTGFYAFVHFSVNTYTGLEWGTGNEDPSIFDPYDLDCDEWVDAITSAGAKGLVLTAKHHDGFCLWPSAYTEHSIKNSPYLNGKGDIVREASEACRRKGIKFGLYLSPWDRNSKLYGTDEYNNYYASQLVELLTGYGEIFLIWQDNACGEGPDGKKQVYDFDRFNSLIRKYQPGACIFNDKGPDVRWCGNESGSTSQAEWAVVPAELCTHAFPQTFAALTDGSLQGIYNCDPDIGTLQNIMYSKGLVFAGSEVDMSIRPGWFYHPDEEPHSLERLYDTYLRSVGHNSCFNLNVPPMPNGRFDQRDIRRLQELGDKIRLEFSSPVKSRTEKISQTENGQCIYSVTLEKETSVRYVILSEDISKGQRIENFRINNDGEMLYSYYGFTVGNRQICKIDREMRSRKFIVTVTSGRDEIFLKDILVYQNTELEDSI